MLHRRSIFIFEGLLFLLVLLAFCFFSFASAQDFVHADASITPESILIEVGESITLTAAPDYGNAYLWYSADSNIVSSTLHGTITGITPGNTVIHVSYLNSDNILYEGTCSVFVRERATIETSTYFFEPNEQGQMLFLSGNSLLLNDLCLTNRAQQEITIHQDGDFYTLYSPSNQAYLGVISSNGGTIAHYITLSQSLQDTFSIPKWRIFNDIDDSSLIFAPCDSTCNDMVLTVSTQNNESFITLSHMMDVGSDINEKWQIYDYHFNVNQFYDISVNGKLTLLSAISQTSSFIDNYAFSQFGDIFSTDIYVHYRPDSKASQCPQPINSPCISATCGNPFNFHKDKLVMWNWLSNNIPRNNNSINVMWADRPYSAYPSGQGCIGYTVFNGHNEPISPSIQMMCLTYYEFSGDLTLGTQAICDICLSHELSHVLGLPEQYTNQNHCSKGEFCIMDRYSTDMGWYYRSQIINGNMDAFCENCELLLNDLIYNLYFKGNAPYA